MSAGQEAKSAIKAQPIKIDLHAFEFIQTTYNGYDEGSDKLNFFENGKAEAKIKVGEEGGYELLVKASCDPAVDEMAKFKIYLDNQPVYKEMLLTATEEKQYKLPINIKAGEHKLTVEFTNDAFKEGEYDRNLFIHGLALLKNASEPASDATFTAENNILAMSRDPKSKDLSLVEAIKVLTTYRKVSAAQYSALDHLSSSPAIKGQVTLTDGKVYTWNIEPGYAATLTGTERETIYLLRPDSKLTPSVP